MNSKSFVFDRENGKRVLKVFGWTMAAALVTLAGDFIGIVDVPAQYAFVVPIVNTLLYALKEYITEQGRV